MKPQPKYGVKASVPHPAPANRLSCTVYLQL